MAAGEVKIIVIRKSTLVPAFYVFFCVMQSDEAIINTIGMEGSKTNNETRRFLLNCA